MLNVTAPLLQEVLLLQPRCLSSQLIVFPDSPQLEMATTIPSRKLSVLIEQGSVTLSTLPACRSETFEDVGLRVTETWKGFAVLIVPAGPYCRSVNSLPQPPLSHAE